MMQYEFGMTNKRTAKQEQARATAKTAALAYEAVSAAYGAEYDVRELPVVGRAPHAIAGEIDCTG